MAGGLFQLIAYGVEDLILTHDPEVTYFKSVFKRYTPFTVEQISQNFIGKVDFGRRFSCIISKQADLISRSYIQITLPKVPFDSSGKLVYAWVENIGYKIIKNINVEIGGQILDKHYSDWLYIWNELICPLEKQTGVNKMTGNVSENHDFNLHINADIDTYICYIPLNFWFCKSPNLALPLISLKYHEVKFNVEFEELENCLLQADVNFGDGVNTFTVFQDQTNISGVKQLNSLAALKSKVFVDFIFLDKKERELFASKQHEYCIEQLQFNEETVFLGDFSNINLNFNHPVKELLWVFQYDRNINNKKFFNYTNVMNLIKITKNGSNNPIFSMNESIVKSNNPVDKVNLYINGKERFKEQNGGYTNRIQQYYHHTNISSNGINTYSFSLYPENIQPSGTSNFSMIDDAILENSLKSFFYDDTTGNQIIESGTGIVRIYAVNYNILKIMDGMGGIVFSN